MTYPDIAPIIVAAVSIAANFALSIMLRREQRKRLEDHDNFVRGLNQLSDDLKETVREKAELQTDYRQALCMVRAAESVRLSKSEAAELRHFASGQVGETKT